MATSAEVSQSVYPAWWASVTTVKVYLLDSANATFNRDDVEIFPWGVSYPDNAGAGWNACVAPWHQINGIVKGS